MRDGFFDVFLRSEIERKLSDVLSPDYLGWGAEGKVDWFVYFFSFKVESRVKVCF